jgi:hypothetical protein
MVNSLDEVIERLQYKADNIKAKLEPSYFTECIDYLKTLPREENEDYAQKLINKVAKTIIEAFENLSIEDVNMYKLGYNKAIDEFAEEFNFNILADSNFMFDRVTLYKKIREIAEQMKGE